METLFPPSSLVERFLYPQIDLPILGSSALEQILESSSSPLHSSSSSSSSSDDMEAPMSPDSSLEPFTSNSNYENEYGNDLHPDSTTSPPLSNYDSDAFNSDDSCSSLVELSIFNSITSSGSSSSLPLYPLSTNNSSKRKKVKRPGDSLLNCHLCSYSTRYKEHLTSHMNTHDSHRNYMCSDCGQTFKWSHSLKRHQRTHRSSDTYEYTCRYCYKTFSRKDHLTIHESLHTQSESSPVFPCSDCGASFKNKKTLSGHLKTHSSEKAFKCSDCESEFTRRASLNRHIRAAHAGHVILCSECPAVFSYRSTLEDHKKAVHNQGRREFGCQLCGVQFAVKAYLSKHMITCRNRANGKTYSCSLCPKNFPTKRHLQDHCKRKHVGESSINVFPLYDSGVSTSSPYDFNYYESSSSSSSSSTNQLELNSPVLNLAAVAVETSAVNDSAEVETVGSLLRLVYNCTEDVPSSEYSDISSSSVKEDLLMNSYTHHLHGYPLDCL